ncbi:DNA mismatch repair endonuclease MutH [Arcicella aurantiaca]|uniref:DNA mismatch repair endonuclease MutH n=1 Tax=Arcicella aurantiaca TaxID=591202 RepID=A0A316EG06_9BACT|nr:MutH/Sau3AI family endonuclease [Arcicella aurantiaca]PWK29031.1 DNA mismatch repair endonuclease MutH [Arcicella aurantiaca]
MLSSKAITILTPLFKIIEESKGKTIGEIKSLLNHERTNMKKGASGLIVETLLGIKNNNNADADIPEIGCEVKILPIQKNRNGEVKVKEPTQIQMINYFEVANEKWETAKIRKKITLTFWIVYLAKENSKSLNQDDYKIIDYFIDHPNEYKLQIFQRDWEAIQSYIINGLSDKLSCSMGEYIEPKTKGANNQDVTNAPDGKGGILKARRRAFYFKKKYTNSQIIPNIDLKTLL